MLSNDLNSTNVVYLGVNIKCWGQNYTKEIIMRILDNELTSFFKMCVFQNKSINFIKVNSLVFQNKLITVWISTLYFLGK